MHTPQPNYPLNPPLKHQNHQLRLALFGLSLCLLLSACGYPDANTTRELAERMVLEAFSGSPTHLKRIEQDPSQQLCSRINNAPISAADASTVLETARASIQYPASGVLMGDWKIGDTLAHDGAGDRIRNGKTEATTQNGGLCQNCHGLAPGEINVGNLGPSLTGYGKLRGTDPAIVKYTYDKIYNAWSVMPCSNMPRLGAMGHLTPTQISHLVAYLLDQKSPINQ